MFSPALTRAVWLVTTGAALSVLAADSKAGSFADGGNTQVSAMMMFVGNSDMVYILDKTEGNSPQVNGHPAWGSVWDFNSHKVDIMDIKTNSFCASGMHLPNGSFATFGGNGAITVGGNIGSQKDPSGSSASYDDVYMDYDGTKSIRVLNPCSSGSDFSSDACKWFDDPSVLSMIKNRWYSAAEPMADGTIVIIGGFRNGGYINRNWPPDDPNCDGGGAECTYEYFPAKGTEAKTMQFLLQANTGGLNSYAHTYMMPSGKMFVQANVSTIMWDHENNVETPLPNMPNNVVRVYPASGATAMLPLTPDNNYTPTILFCGGQSGMSDEGWGSYANPNQNPWEFPASQDCQRITPEPTDGSQPAYEQDDNMLEGRTMGQFIILPDGKMLVVNGGNKGTAGYADKTGQVALYGDMPFGMSLAADPVGTPAIYDPKADKGKRWSNSGFATSNIARLYHSSALLLPDASVMIAGSNPNVDVNTTTVYPTEYRAEIFYPPYFSATTRPNPSGIPQTLGYGGDPFDIKIPSNSYSGESNKAAEEAIVAVIRPGWTTHGMNMGQRFLQLQHSYTVNDDGSLVLHTAQMPPNANIFQPGPAFVYVTINGVPSNGSYVIVGSGKIEQQQMNDASTLATSQGKDGVTGSADSSSTGSNGSSNTTSNSSSPSTGIIVGAVVGGLAVLGILGAIVGICISRRRRAASRQTIAPSSEYKMNNVGGGAAAGGMMGAGGPYAQRQAPPGFAPVYDRDYYSQSDVNLASPHTAYRDEPADFYRQPSGTGMSMDYDPYTRDRMQTSSPGGHRF